MKRYKVWYIYKNFKHIEIIPGESMKEVADWVIETYEGSFINKVEEFK